MGQFNDVVISMIYLELESTVPATFYRSRHQRTNVYFSLKELIEPKSEILINYVIAPPANLLGSLSYYKSTNKMNTKKNFMWFFLFFG